MMLEYVPPDSLIKKNQFGPGGAGSFRETTGKSSSDLISGISGDELYNMFGTKPEKVYSDFDASYGKAANRFGPFDGSRLDTETERNEGLFDEARGIADVSETLGALQKSRGVNLAVGQQLAAGASRRFLEQSQPGGTSGVGASILRAQALLPFLQQDYEGAASERRYADTKKTEAINTASNVAQTLANLATTYTQSLADYNSQKANSALQFANQRTGLGLQASSVGRGNALDLLKTQLQLRENARQANLQDAARRREQDFVEDQASRRSEGIPAFSGSLGFQPTGGGAFQASPEYLAYKQRYGIS
jgi:hypothetical protein